MKTTAAPDLIENAPQRVATHPPAKPDTSPAFKARLEAELATLTTQLRAVYGQRTDEAALIAALIAVMEESDQQRPTALKQLDAMRIQDPDWFQSETMVGGVCYVDLFAGNLQGVRAKIPYFQSLGLTYLHLMPLFLAPEKENDGGYAVSSYRDVQPTLGSMADLNLLASELRQAGISLVLDFIFNHTSNEHVWAQKCLAGDPAYQDFYLIYPDRTLPDQYEQHVREIFPEEHPGAFTQLADGRWVWTTFHRYQWDLNYANPQVLLAMAREMLFIANQGAEILRMDAVAFLWKQLGTHCENLPQVHTLIQIFNTIARIAAPSLMFKSEAIVHPDDVVKYIDPRECQLSYNPLQMALLWSTLATREVNLLQHALQQRHALTQGCSWVNYVRSHDDIGWTFSDEDAANFYIDGFLHRQFLNQFYLNQFPGSFAEGVAFQENKKNGDCRICGTSASLVGLGRQAPYAIERLLALYNIVLTAGGIPLIYLGDELGVLNDYTFTKDPAKAADSRWVHRVAFNERLLNDALQHPQTHAYQIYQALRQMIATRKQTKAFAGGQLALLETGNPSVLAYLRSYQRHLVFVFANFSEHAQTVTLNDVTLRHRTMHDLYQDAPVSLTDTYTLAPYQFAWLTF